MDTLHVNILENFPSYILLSDIRKKNKTGTSDDLIHILKQYQ